MLTYCISCPSDVVRVLVSSSCCFETFLEGGLFTSVLAFFNVFFFVNVLVRFSFSDGAPAACLLFVSFRVRDLGLSTLATRSGLVAKLTTNGRVGWRFESRLCFFAPPEGHTETQGRDYTHHTCGRRSRVRTPLNHTMCASPYKNRDLIHDLLGLSPPLPNQAPGPGTWSLLEKSSLTKSKTCIIGSKFFFYYL